MSILSFKITQNALNIKANLILYLIFFLRIFLIRIFFIRILFIRIFFMRIFCFICNVVRDLFFFNNMFTFKKHLTIFTCCKSRIDQNYRSANKLRTFFWYFVTVNICVGFSIIRFYFNFYIFFILFRSTIKFFFDTTFDYFPNFIKN